MRGRMAYVFLMDLLDKLAPVERLIGDGEAGGRGRRVDKDLWYKRHDVYHHGG